MNKILKNFKGLSNNRDRTPTKELTQSDYSLVSCAELSPAAVELWMELPDEVKYDPALAPFKRQYEKKKEKETPKVQIVSRHSAHDMNKIVGAPDGTLPNVASAPLLSTNDGFKSDAENNSVPRTSLGDSLQKQKPSCPSFYYIKMTVVVLTWCFFTGVFLCYNEIDEVVRHTSIAPGENKQYLLDSHVNPHTVYISVQGPFLSRNEERSLNATQSQIVSRMTVWLERWPKNDTGSSIHTSQKWTIALEKDDMLDFTEGETRAKVLEFQGPVGKSKFEHAIRMSSSAAKTVPFTLSYRENPISPSLGIILSMVLLVGLYVLIIFEIINRTMAAVLMSTTALAVLSVAGERPSLEEFVSWLDMETLVLLFSMMVLVAICAETGMFDFLAVYAFKLAKGETWPLIMILCAITALISTMLDNVTTILLITPITIRLCEVMELNAIAILTAMVIYSNIGGTVTPVGDPPNVIIASNKEVVAYGINFTNFTMHMSIGIMLVSLQAFLQLKYCIYKNPNSLRLGEPKSVQDLKRQRAVWKRTAASLPRLSADQLIVGAALEKKVKKITSRIEEMSKTSHEHIKEADYEATLADLSQKYKIRDLPLLIKTSIAIFFVVVVFFLHSVPELRRLSLGFTALLGAILLLLLADKTDLEPILHKVEWSTLLFFASLFVFMESLAKLGLINWIGEYTEILIMKVSEEARLAVAIVIILWITGIVSAFVDNIPLTTMMVRVVTSLGSNASLKLPMAPLIWALSFGACLGGNGTLIGASANVVCAGVAEQHGYKMSFMQFFKVGFPLMIGHLIVAMFYLLFVHCVLTWH